MNATRAQDRVKETGRVLIYIHGGTGLWTMAASDEPKDWIGGNYKTPETAQKTASRLFKGAIVQICD